MSKLTITRELTPTKGRYVGRIAGRTDEAELTFSRANPALVIADHTEVPENMRGTGIGQVLVDRLIADARSEGCRPETLIRHEDKQHRYVDRRTEMSWNPTLEPGCPDSVGVDAIETLIIPRARDLGGFEVRRALPSPKRQMVGPFVFFDQAGPAEFVTGNGIDVRPHPHIGLATVTYLYRGEFHHRDSLGSNQIILPGAVNWMVAGKGVTHSERTSEATRKAPHSLFGIQTWVALPEDVEDIAPAFEHHAKEALPEIEADGATLRLVLGQAYGEKAPASIYSETFYVDAVLQPGARVPLPDDHEDRGIYVTEGTISVAGQDFEAGRMIVFRPGDQISIAAGPEGARLMLLGGATLNGPRYVWWNFVSSSKERLEHAKEEWRQGDWGNGMFDLPAGDRDEFIPLPD